MGNIIRFFSTDKPDQPMDILTIEDLKADGFVNYRFINHFQVPTRGYADVIESQQYLVHNTVPIDRRHMANEDVPYIDWIPGASYEAKWGAMRFPLRNDHELQAFMRLFDYPIVTPQIN